MQAEGRSTMMWRTVHSNRMGLAVLAIVAGLLLSRSASANGGTVQVSRALAGPFEVTVWTDPSPIRVGTVDVSVMVELPGGSPLQDARVSVTVWPMSNAGRAATYEATHDQATNKLFYAAHVPIPQAGPWQVKVTIVELSGDGDVSFMIEASETSISDRVPLVVFVVLLIGLTVAAGVSRYRSTWGQQPKSP